MLACLSDRTALASQPVLPHTPLLPPVIEVYLPAMQQVIRACPRAWPSLPYLGARSPNMIAYGTAPPTPTFDDHGPVNGLMPSRKTARCILIGMGTGSSFYLGNVIPNTDDFALDRVQTRSETAEAH